MFLDASFEIKANKNRRKRKFQKYNQVIDGLWESFSCDGEK